MDIRTIEHKKTWDTFVEAQSPHTFLHAWAWGEFNAAMGDGIHRLGIYEGGELVAAALVIRVRARRGNFLFVPHGPVFASGKQIAHFQFSILKKLAATLKEIATREGASFIRISPLLPNTAANRSLFHILGFRPAPTHIHAETTWTLDLLPDEKELLAGMRKTTRNLIRRANREGVKITVGNDKDDMDAFYSLYCETSKKQHFTPFSRRYIAEEVRAFAKEENVFIVLGWYSGKPQAGAVIPTFGKRAYYHHGASSHAYAKIPTAYAVQWAAIKEARGRGARYYNFWGIAPNEDDPNHPWAGLTLFKKGFGGYRTDYLHAQDLPLSWKYWISWGIETLRRKKRNL